MGGYRDEIDANPVLQVAMAIDKIASVDLYFVQRGLKANADLLGCFLYTAMYVIPWLWWWWILSVLELTRLRVNRGFDEEPVTIIIGLSRAAGGLAHWRESSSKCFGIFVSLIRPDDELRLISC
jgi:citrate synthase